MSNAYSANARIFAAIMHKNMRRMYQDIPKLLLDGLCPSLAQLLVFGYLAPLLGMPQEIAGPAYLGNIMSLFFQLGYALTMQMGFDLETNRFIDYQLTLPLTKSWLFATFIVTNMLETAAVMIPLLTIGIILLPARNTIVHIDWPALIVLFPLILLFFATFFLVIAFRYNFWWIRTNFWPRRMLPLFFVSAAFAPWHRIFSWNSTLAYGMLLNPITYIIEGLRASILGGHNYVSPWYCMIAIIIFIIINCRLLSSGITSKLDPV